MAEQDSISIEPYVQKIGSKMSLLQMSRKLGIPLRFLTVGSFNEAANPIPVGYTRTTFNGEQVTFNGAYVFDDGKNLYYLKVN